MEKDAIMGHMSLARYISEDKAIMLLEYTIMGLALMLFLSFPLKVAPALAYGLLPPLFFLAKGIDFYNEQTIFDHDVTDRIMHQRAGRSFAHRGYRDRVRIDFPPSSTIFILSC
jgi:hypothetical protein